jgi:ATP-dependent DNA helicase RecG
VQFLRFEGTDLADPVRDAAAISGPLPEMLRALEEKLLAHLEVSREFRIGWFSDRIEILSPGEPYGQVTKANFGAPDATDYRNLYLAEAMRNLGFVQKFRVGIALARREMEKTGNPALEFRAEDSSVLAILRRRP